LIARTLSHYHILAAIGAGGMGEVYRATDTKLGRQVALKVLPAEMALDPQRLMRFRREARAVAALNHPHIVTIFSVEEAEGVHFLTMELVEGQPLDRLIPEGGLAVGRIVEIATALAAALAAAHEKGIVHRDLKPANVMVTGDGRVKVLDFGLAKETAPVDAGEATQTRGMQTEVGVVMGTPAYMSPEQVAGEAVDCRTDIFSLGIVLYEMASGERPFKGRSSAEVVSAILRDTPRAIGEVRADLPADLARVIRRCLEKDPRSRVQTAQDVYNDLRELARQPATTVIEPVSRSASASGGSPGSSGAPRSVVAPGSGASRANEGFWVAVLPFRYAGGNAELIALAEGLSEDIVTGLSRFSYLRVIARSSSSRYAHELLDVRSAGKALGARYVMEGSLRQAGVKVRIAVQLVDTSTGAHLWAENYDRAFQPETVFELQDDVVSRIVCTVADSHGVLPHSMSEAVRGKGSDQLSAYEALLHSFGYFERVSAEEHAVTRENLERAVQQAPGNAECWAMLTIFYVEEYIHGFNPRPDPLDRALGAARRAVENAPASNLAYHALATVLFYRRELQAFRNAAERAVALNPMDGYTAAYQGFLTAYAGEWERGCALAARARKLNPHHPGWYWFPEAFDAYRKGDYPAALDAALKINMPRFWRAHLALAMTYGQLGERDAARAALQQLLALRPEFAVSARQELSKTWDAEFVSHMLEGLRKAGLKIAADAGTIPIEL
jgi:serine/threonine protein kinase